MKESIRNNNLVKKMFDYKLIHKKSMEPISSIFVPEESICRMSLTSILPSRSIGVTEG